MQTKKKQCYFTVNKIEYIDYKNVKMLRRFIDRFGRIKARYYTGTTLRKQKQLEKAVKRARIMGLLPFLK
ncbi:30S ribosomal protein S18 [Candidatus Gracilibacteria bacterium CG17_big_fil_post_rev_8_21_14_2_50_48_13]|nr:MAG: 30S ribosomal protein S18 [Candidatus Gracilibacteria bacterium CG17_big_fil_post_rev_8_21_14_2_50_48_13]